MVVYDPAIWTEFGFIVQRYIGSAVGVAVAIVAVIFGVGLLIKVVGAILRW